MKAAIAYIRFSSDQQADGSSIERQTEIIERHIKLNGLELTAKFTDEGKSAFKGHHLTEGHLGRILADVDAGKYRGYALVVEKMDRFSRLGIEETFALTRRLLKGGVELHLAAANRVCRSLDDMPTVILNTVESYGAQEYAKNLTAAIRRGWARAKANAAKGEFVTRNVPAWLTARKEDDKIVEIVENEKADAVREAFRLAGLGIGSKNILRELNGRLARESKGYSLSWLTRTLCNRAVLGEFQPHRYAENGRRVPDGDVVPNYFPAIVTQSEFDAARAEITRKNRIPNDKRYRGGGDRFSNVANNLFSGLLKDVTSEPERGMGFAAVNGIAYLSSVFSADGRKSNRIKYKKFESAFLCFLKDLDWKSVAGQSESDEEKAASVKLETVLTELDRAARLVAAKTAAADEETDVAASRFLAAQIARLEARVSTLEAERNALHLTVEAARAKCTTLHSPEALRDLIAAGDNETRLRLRTEIRRRISRIEFTFGFSFAGLGAGGWTKVRIRFINGTERLIILKGEGYLLLGLSPKS